MDFENRLQTYIAGAKASGLQNSQIREALITAGYPQDIIERAIATQTAAPTVTEPQSSPKKIKHLKIIMVIIGILLILAVISSSVIVRTQQENPIQATQKLPANMTSESIDFDGRTFSFNYPKSWTSDKTTITNADRKIRTADYTQYDTAGGNGDHGLIQQGAVFEIHVGKYGTGGISGFKNDLEQDELKGFYKPLSVAEHISQISIKGKPAVSYTETMDYRHVIIIFFDKDYAVQLSYKRPYAETPGNVATVDTTYQEAFYDMVGSFTIE